ncbi:cation:proton antiporter [Paraburkholderia sp. A3BS-1L]|uniref:cation:proton antiporter domain-containing protein n=1 Tax=Paraburkholderia sp. A3BS-1L TaxID=3028375 RepID=UPI003DA7DB67
MTIIAAFIATVFLYGLLSGRLERTVLTAPIVFAASGALMHFSREALHELTIDRHDLLMMAKLGLVMILFTAASRVRPSMLEGENQSAFAPAQRGDPLTIAPGLLCAKLVFPALTWPETGILASILAPTDAGLGQIIVNNPQVPARIRQALNVEAGLNDGLSVPFLMLFHRGGRGERNGSKRHGPRTLYA